MEKINLESINKFWDWFKSVSRDLLDDPTRSDLIYQIDSRINKFGRFDWEIGPWKEETYYLAISPNLDAAKLEFTREFVKKAPKCIGWHFLPSKPPKSDWKGVWKMRNEKGKEILGDSNNWKYILYEFEDETFDMDIMIDAVDGGDNSINIAIEITLTGYLGEETFMQLIKNLEIVSSFDGADQSTGTLIKHIKKHIESILHSKKIVF